MNMPELVPENHAAIYDYLRNFEPNTRIQNLGFALMRLTYKSDVHFEGETEAIITEHVQSGGNLIVAPNHQSNADMPAVGALAYEPCFRRLKGTTTAPGKVDMFGWPVLGKHLFPHLRVHPTFRSKDFPDSEAGKQLWSAATDSLIDYNIDFIDSGGHVAIFPEGTRNKGNPREIQKIKAGIARIALGVKDPSRVLVVPVGFAYKSPKLHLRPVAMINEPFCPEGMTQDELLTTVGSRMQAAVSEAFTLATS